MKRILVRMSKALALTGITIALLVTTAYAIGYTWGPSSYLGGSVRFWGIGNNDVVLDPKGVAGDLNSKVTLWVSEGSNGSKACMSTGFGGSVVDGLFKANRGEIAVVRTGSGEVGKAGIQSSANARVVAEDNGDVVITLGN